jgi:hypothetical protein
LVWGSELNGSEMRKFGRWLDILGGERFEIYGWMNNPMWDGESMIGRSSCGRVCSGDDVGDLLVSEGGSDDQ